MITSNSFTPFFGLVEDNNDTEHQIGRVKVRIFGYNAGIGILPTEMLRWFVPINSNNAQLNGVGVSPTGYKIGSFVFGFYIDEEMQNGIIIGSVAGIHDEINDVNDIARGVISEHITALRDSVKKGHETSTDATWDEPETPYAAVYPENMTYTTSSGHVIEVDDTKDAERIKVFHRTGTMLEIHPDGTIVRRHVKDDYRLTTGNKFSSTEGNNTYLVKGDDDFRLNGDQRTKIDKSRFEQIDVDEEVKIDGNQTIVIGKDETITIHGNETLEVDGDRKRTVHGNESVQIDGNETVTIEKNNDVTINGKCTIDVQGNTVLRAPNIQLGEDGAVEPSVLGNKLAAWITTELVPWLNQHNHIGNYGAPTSPAATGTAGPFQAGSGATGGAVYSKVNTNQ